MTTPEGGPGPDRKLDRSLVSGIAWTGGMRGATQAVQWLAALLVVRMLTPGDYGLVGMATAYLGLVRLISEFGLGASIIQHRELGEESISRLAGVSLLFACVFAGVSVAGAGLIASFYGEPAVESIIMVLSLTFLAGGIDVVPRSLMKRDLQFRRLAWVQAAENLSYAAGTLILAALGLGVWALVLGALIGNFARMACALWSRPQRVRWPAPFASISEPLRFGWHVVAARLAIYVRQFADIAIVGRMLGTAQLGAYTVAWTQANIPVDRVTALANEVVPSVLAASRHDQAAMRRYLRIITQGIAFISFPATLGMALLADHFVLLVFGPHWEATIAPLRVLAIVGALRAITPVLSQVLIAKGQAKLNMHFTVASAILIPILLMIGARWGLTGVAMAWLIGQPLTMIPILMPQALRAVGMSKREYFASLRPAIVACLVMGTSVLAVRFALPAAWPLAARFPIEVAAGMATYGAMAFISYRSQLTTFLSLLRRPRTAPAADTGSL